jgi:DNA-binding transcriptional ArsR family regulator
MAILAVEAMEIKRLAQEFSALGSEDRLRILGLLLGGKLPSCGEIAEELGLSNPAVSYHLRMLEEAGFILRTRRGRARCLELTPRLRELLRADVLRELKEEVGHGA